MPSLEGTAIGSRQGGTDWAVFPPVSEVAPRIWPLSSRRGSGGERNNPEYAERLRASRWTPRTPVRWGRVGSSIRAHRRHVPVDRQAEILLCETQTGW